MSVQVFGTVLSPRISGESVTSTYTIDGSGTTPYSSAQILQSITTSEADGLQFFDSGTLSNGDHVLVINVTSATSSDPYYLDYIQYVQTSATTTSSSASSTSSTTTTSSATSSPSNSGGSKPHIGAIVGGVVGGVCFLAVVALGIFLFLRYFRHRIGLSGRKRGGRGTSVPGPLYTPQILARSRPTSQTSSSTSQKKRSPRVTFPAPGPVTAAASRPRCPVLRSRTRLLTRSTPHRQSCPTTRHRRSRAAFTRRSSRNSAWQRSGRRSTGPSRRDLGPKRGQHQRGRGTGKNLYRPRCPRSRSPKRRSSTKIRASASGTGSCRLGCCP